VIELNSRYNVVSSNVASSNVVPRAYLGGPTADASCGLQAHSVIELN
jgi:hypothetical protein